MRPATRLLSCTAIALLFTGCTPVRAPVDQHFGNRSAFGGGTFLDLNDDHTFMYVMESDVIGDHCVAKGAWNTERHGQFEFIAIRVDSVDEGEPGTCDYVRKERLWLITDNGVVSVGEYIENQKPRNHQR